MPEFAHVRPSQILVVAGDARRSSHATIRPMHFPSTHSRMRKDRKRKKPKVSIYGKRILYVITLRPIWFRVSTPHQRVSTLMHELFHISTRFDGTLHAGRRHSKLGKRFNKKLLPLVRRYLRRAPAEVLAPFSYSGLVRVRQWLERPPSSYPVRKEGNKRVRHLYTEEQLFIGLARMITPGS